MPKRRRTTVNNDNTGTTTLKVGIAIEEEDFGRGVVLDDDVNDDVWLELREEVKALALTADGTLA